MRLFAILAAWAFAASAHAATLSATPVTLTAMVAQAQAGDTVGPVAGNYGDVQIHKVVTGQPVIIAPAPGAVFRSLNIYASSGLVIQGLSVRFTPDAKTVAWSAAVTVQGSHDITISHASVIGAPAVNGVPDTASVADATGNILGRPAGYGVSIAQSQRIDLTDSFISTFHRPVVLNAVDGANISRNTIRDRRTTAIQGAEVSNVTVNDNDIDGANPVRWGLPNGDHADVMAFWSNAGQTHANDNLRIVNNWMAQTSGAAILGAWAQGTDAAPFTNLIVTGNMFLIPNLQGFLAINVHGGQISGNTFMQAQVQGLDPRQAPTILLRAGVSGLTMTGNTVSAPISDLSGGVNPQTGTRLLAGSFSAPALAVGAIADPRDAQIVALTAQIAAANDNLKAANSNLTAAQAWIAKVRAAVTP